MISWKTFSREKEKKTRPQKISCPGNTGGKKDGRKAYMGADLWHAGLGAHRSLRMSLFLASDF